MALPRPSTEDNHEEPVARPRRLRTRLYSKRCLSGMREKGPGGLDEALARVRRSLRRREQKGDHAGMAICYLQIGDLYLASGEAERAGEMYRKSLEISRRLGQGPVFVL